MDPNTLLEQLLETARSLMGQKGRDAGEANTLAVSILDLDEWIAKGGFLPRRWERKETMTTFLHLKEINRLQLQRDVLKHGIEEAINGDPTLDPVTREVLETALKKAEEKG